MSADVLDRASGGALRPTLVPDLVELVAVPSRDALVEGSGRRVTWADLEDEVARVATGLGFDALRAAEPRAVTARPDPETLACLLYTGSTTDLPRAAMLSHRALLANIEQTTAVLPPLVRSGDVVLGVLPLFHVYGLNAV